MRVAPRLARAALGLEGDIAVRIMEDGKPRGVLLWNVWDRLDDARELLRAGEGALAV